MGKDYKKEIYDKLRIAYAKLLVAENARKRKNSRIMRTLYLSAIVGNVFVTPEFMANIYFSSSISDIKKIKKRIRKILGKPSISAEDKFLLEELDQILRVDKDMRIGDLKLIISEAMKVLGAV